MACTYIALRNETVLSTEKEIPTDVDIQLIAVYYLLIETYSTQDTKA